MRERLVRSEDKTQQTQNLAELITKYGAHGWMDKMMEVAGPGLLYYCESLADLLDVIQKYVSLPTTGAPVKY